MITKVQEQKLELGRYRKQNRKLIAKILVIVMVALKTSVAIAKQEGYYGSRSKVG